MKWFRYSDWKMVHRFEAESELEAKWHSFFLALDYSVSRVAHPEMSEIGPCLYIEDWEAFVYICEHIDEATNAYAAALADSFLEHTIILVEGEPGQPRTPEATIHCGLTNIGENELVPFSGKFFVGGVMDATRDKSTHHRFAFWNEDGIAFVPRLRMLFSTAAEQNRPI